jgi:hypothetical protein
MIHSHNTASPSIEQEDSEKEAMQLMDLNGDKRVSRGEFIAFCREHADLPGTLLQQHKEGKASAKLSLLPPLPFANANTLGSIGAGRNTRAAAFAVQKGPAVCGEYGRPTRLFAVQKDLLHKSWRSTKATILRAQSSNSTNRGHEPLGSAPPRTHRSDRVVATMYGNAGPAPLSHQDHYSFNPCQLLVYVAMHSAAIVMMGGALALLMLFMYGCRRCTI